MNDKKILAVIGQGFVGGALTTVMSRTYDVFAYDKAGRYALGAACTQQTGAELRMDAERSRAVPKFQQPSPQSVQELVQQCETQEGFTGVYFVCLPTPMRPDGSCDVSIVEGVLKELANAEPAPLYTKHNSDGSVDIGCKFLRIAVVKSTVPPGTVAQWNERFKDTFVRVVFQPEFLTEANALRDFEEQTRIVIGGEHPWSDRVEAVFRAAFPRTPIIKTSSTNAEMVKYLTNCFLSVKVAFANEMRQACTALGADYGRVIEVALHDPRLGETHWAVPGPDGHLGFGGSCFPKDINALVHAARVRGVKVPVLEGAWAKNIEVRPGRDWEQLKGRAVSS